MSARAVMEQLIEPIDTPRWRQELEDELLNPSRLVSSSSALHWQRQTSPRSLMHVEPSQPTTSLEFVTKGLDGTIVGYREVSHRGQRKTAKNSTDLTRKAGDHKGFVRGKSAYYPFRPGGLVSVDLDDESDDVEAIERAIERKEGIKTIPPGFTRGLDFSEQDENAADELLDDADVIKVEPIYQPLADITNDTGMKAVMNGKTPAKLDPAIAELLPQNRSLATSVATAHSTARKRPVMAKKDWAHVVDVHRALLNFHQLVPDPARTYPFELDTFQKEAIYHMELGDSVFVAAHTSAGKTVVAEYGIALAIRHMTRAIYTSPIKALSNQKFRDFQQTFGPSQVGILTGDVQINPDAPCLIMTTEILRSMLYKGADLIRDVEWVIFDEVHYVNDLERGVVWEEVIIMLPDHVGIILLSATVPNTREFADWVGRTKCKDIYVISTPKRPVPLEHFLYAGKDIHKVVDSRGQFIGEGYKSAGDALKRRQEKEREVGNLPPLAARGGRGGAAGRGANRGGGQPIKSVAARGAANAVSRGGRAAGANSRAGSARDSTLWVPLVGLLKKKELLPVVVFTFSKKRCEAYADSLPNTDLCDAKEKSEIHVVIERSITRLRGEDKTLPQIQHMRALLAKGIGVHHGGLLPIVKEIVEILFARGLVKVLFATETFAMGVNMPAKCVVFSDIRKHDGRSFRDLLPGEYTQMSGRAGRRGLDKTGTVIILAEGELPDTPTLTNMILGPPTKLSSQFRLTYSMILNLLRVEALRVEEMIKRSFSENASQRLMPEHQKKVTEGESELRSLKKLEPGQRTDEISRFYDLNARLVALNLAVVEGSLGHPASAKIMSAGRVVILSDGHFRGNPAILLKNAPAVLPNGSIETTRQFYALAFVSAEMRSGKRDRPVEAVPPRWPPILADTPAEELTYELTTVSTSSIAFVTDSTLKVDVESIVDRNRRSEMEKALSDFVAAFGNGSCIARKEADWSKVRSLDFRQAINERDSLKPRLDSFDVFDDAFERDFEALHGQRVLEEKIALLRLAISDQNLELLPDYEARIAVLKELRFIDESSTVLVKGRVACEINSANELILTELILDNTFATFEPAEIVALLSAFVFQEKVDMEPVLTDKLLEGRAIIEDIATRVRDVQSRHRADAYESSDFSTSLKYGLVEVVYEWARGTSFADLMSLVAASAVPQSSSSQSQGGGGPNQGQRSAGGTGAGVQEGTIVRTITRLDETCREVRDAARIVGNSDLFEKMEKAQLLIRRDIVFCASLYF